MHIIIIMNTKLEMDGIEKLGLKLDPWQKEVLEEWDSNIAIRTGRQVGKSTVIALKTAMYALKNPNKTIMIIAAVERQSYLLFEKVIETLLALDPSQVGKKKDKPTKSYMKLKNGTKIYCLPTGRTGYGIRGYTLDILIADEAAYIGDEVWAAVVPMLATTGGKQILLSTPKGKTGYFYECFKAPHFKNWHVSSEDCPRMEKAFLDIEKRRMTKLQYAQEYLGEFLEELQRFFTTDLIDECMTLNPGETPAGREYYLGVDVARYGGDENAFVVVQYTNRTNLKAIYVETRIKEATTQTAQRVLELNQKYNFRKIFIDDGGIGGAVLDVLLENTATRTKAVGLNNATVTVKETRRRLLKEDMYVNLLKLMELGCMRLIKHTDLKLSLESIQFDYSDEKNLRIFGKYSHITEALIRAAWCIKEKGLKLFIM